MYELALNATKEVVFSANFSADYALVPEAFFFVRFAFDNLAALPVVPGPGTKPQLLWLLVLLVIPVALLVFGVYKLVQYVRWKRYGRSLRVHLDQYETGSYDDGDGGAAGADAEKRAGVMAVISGLGTGDWADGQRGADDPAEAVVVADGADALDDFDLGDLDTLIASPQDGGDDDGTADDL